ncbi:hypothetical protein KSP40_PGU019670 [Platanthera guangdongensis]|uniref:Calcium uniporter protein C-terminal domain-containing protein n=1 Tax=Platanthera guangdongensis TaxID=2320717 RepID=A0ABR2M061_9ASPA
MAFRRTLVRSFFDAAKTCSGQIRSGFAAAADASSGRISVLRRIFPDAGNRGIQWRPIVQAAVPPDRIPMPSGIKLFDRFSWPAADNLRRDMLAPPPPPPICSEGKEREREGMRMTVKEARKVLKASQMELVRSRMREIPKSAISSSEFLRICSEVSSVDQGLDLARSLDDSGAVIAIGNVVFLRPDQMNTESNTQSVFLCLSILQLAKAIENIIPMSLSSEHDPRKEELAELERKKAMIDKLAEAGARRELWCGLGFLAAQTAAFMRLTFWELSWDVMEPICFYVTSFYFMAGYVFFMRTSTDPSFEGFFSRRFAAKQRRLMKARDFDLRRFNELRGVTCSCTAPMPEFEIDPMASSCCECK